MLFTYIYLAFQKEKKIKKEKNAKKGKK